MTEQEQSSIDEKATMTNANPFQNQGGQEQEGAENQPALRMPRVDRQRDAGSGLTSGTAPGVDSTDSYQYEGNQSIGPGSDPHGGAGDGTGITTGQFRGSDDGTTTEPRTVHNPGNNQGTNLSRNQQSSADYRPGTSQVNIQIKGVERSMSTQSRFFETHGRVERAYLIAVRSDEGQSILSTEDSLNELDALTRTAGAEVVGTLIQHLRHPDPATYLGKGRVQELSDLEKQVGFDLVIFDDELTPTQQRNLEDLLNARVIDRTALILDIFAHHARTREGSLQVELAQLEYRLPRLSGHGTKLSRVGGGSIGGAIGVRGPGETKLEIDRRRIRHRISEVREEIEAIREQRQLNRQQRAAQAIATIAVVGYTNAGKSTLFNALSAAHVVAENKLFATLDPTTRHLTLPHNQEALLTDTVGFIQKLPTELIAAFRATLEEISNANLLLEVVDSSHENLFEQSETVDSLLKELGAAQTPRVTALNKIDLVEHPEALDTTIFPHAVPISALQGTGLDTLREEIARVLTESMVPICVTLPYNKGDLVELFHRRGHIELEEHLEDGTLFVGHIPHALREYYAPYLCVPDYAEKPAKQQQSSRRE